MIASKVRPGWTGRYGQQYGQQQGNRQNYSAARRRWARVPARISSPASSQPQGQGMDGNRDGFVSRVEEPTFSEGIVEVSGKGFGFLREAKRSFVQTPADVFVTPEVCRKYNLRDGQWIKGEVRRSSRGPQLFRLTELNGEDPEKFKNLPNFDELTSINPKKRVRLETTPDRYTTRVMDLMTPIGKGQRGLIVAPPRTGKTTLLQHIAEAVVKNHPEMKLIILLVDERPEEVTEIRRTVPQAEIMASSNDSDLKNHTRIAQLAMERSKRLVEAGFDVFMLLDSITRMGRAFNNALGGGGGATGSGGVGTRALEIPRKIFAAARNTEEAGSLTIMATALIDTGSRADEVIFLEFKGTGQHGTGAGPQDQRSADFPGGGHFRVGHAPRGTALAAVGVGQDQRDPARAGRSQAARSHRTAAELFEEVPDQRADADEFAGVSVWRVKRHGAFLKVCRAL